MINPPWRRSDVFPPMNGQPVWVYHDGSKDVYGQQHREGVHKAIFQWSGGVHTDYPFWWEIPTTVIMTGGLYGNRLWMPRLDNETPEPPQVPTLPDIKPILAHERPLQ